MKCLIAAAAVLAMVSSSWAGDLSRDFVKDGKGMAGCIKSPDAELVKGKGVRLDKGCAVVTEEALGDGIFHLRFTVYEADEMCKGNHCPRIVIGLTDPAAIKEGPALVTDGCYCITWLPSGEVDSEWYSGKRIIGGTQSMLSPLQDPFKPTGPAPETKYTKDKAADITIVVSKAGGDVQVFLNKAEAVGKPTCTFKLPEGFTVKGGSFGLWNNKMFSGIYLNSLEYHALPAKP